MAELFELQCRAVMDLAVMLRGVDSAVAVEALVAARTATLARLATEADRELFTASANNVALFAEAVARQREIDERSAALAIRIEQSRNAPRTAVLGSRIRELRAAAAPPTMRPPRLSEDGTSVVVMLNDGGVAVTRADPLTPNRSSTSITTANGRTLTAEPTPTRSRPAPVLSLNRSIGRGR